MPIFLERAMQIWHAKKASVEAPVIWPQYDRENLMKADMEDISKRSQASDIAPGPYSVGSSSSTGVQRIQNTNLEDGKDKTGTVAIDLQRNRIESPRNTVDTPVVSPCAAPRYRSGSYHSSPMSESEAFRRYINMPLDSPSPGPSGTQPVRGNTHTHITWQGASPGPGDKRGNSAVRTPTHQRSMELRPRSPSSVGSNPAAGHSPSGKPVSKRARATSSTSNLGATRNRAMSVSSSPLAPASSRSIPHPASTGNDKEQGYIGRGKEPVKRK